MKKWPLLLALFCISITTNQLFAGDDYSDLLQDGTATYENISFPFTVLSPNVLIDNSDEYNPVHYTLARIIARDGTPYTIKLRHNAGWIFCNEDGSDLFGFDPDPALFDCSFRAYTGDFLRDNKKGIVVIGASTITALATAYGTNWYNKKKGTNISPYKTAAVAWVTTAALVIGGYYITSPAHDIDDIDA